MRKFLLLLVVLTGTMSLYAQQAPTPATDSLAEYIGKYVFPDGSEVPEIKMTLENGVLMGAAIQGSSEFKRVDRDLFDIVAYQGVAKFNRDENGKITSLHIEVGDLVLDGKKVEEQAPGK